MRRAREPKPARTLARQLGVAIAAMLTGAVIFIAAASAGVDKLIELELKARLPARLVAAIQTLDQNRLPDNADMLALIQVTSAEEPRIVMLSYGAIAVMTLICIALGVVIAGQIARRLAASLETLADGAQKIAAGDFTHRIAAPPKLAVELLSLIDSFNGQAEALERSERRMRFQTASVAHELRTPLTVLRGYIHGVLDGVFPRDDHHMRALLTQVEDLSRIIDDLRTVSLASSGALALEIGVCDLAAEARAVLDVSGPQLQAAGMIVDTALKPVWVRADPARVRQMLLAVLDNARRYAERRITVDCRARPGAVLLTVADDGPGIPAEVGAAVFEAGRRSRPDDGHDGAGLGLPLALRLARTAGGDITLAESGTGTGTGAVFRLTLPTG